MNVRLKKKLFSFLKSQKNAGVQPFDHFIQISSKWGQNYDKAISNKTNTFIWPFGGLDSSAYANKLVDNQWLYHLIKRCFFWQSKNRVSLKSYS